ncbi:RagB/SusD family nutrient uptake outer membrane protein [Pedobacter nutrimenti]|uniref:RagB/SusD family nutrient uptake outer membrane protein n=1 Tax=Pedobacter nutrimenti TaxID=1241337 RepID=UPI002931E315|nr:RagB/SusD family nutrient uptake outer membrane protein [Pedobacter nutrimenti]
MKKLIYLCIFLLVLLAGCKKDFLNKTPQIELTEETAFNNYDNFKTYTWGLYDYFSGYGNGGDDYPPSLKSSDCNSDDLAITLAGLQSPYAYQTKVIKGIADNTPAGSLSIAQWDFRYIRSVNVMLDNIDRSQMNQADKDHWRSVGYFFRALRYYDLIAAFGDVPWIEHKLSDTSAVLFAPKTPRDLVAKNILENLVFAESHIKAAGEGPNTINTSCVRALISRFGLFEGTWRKYHNLGSANIYLQACKTYSEKLMLSFPTCMSNYDDVYNLEDLTGQPGIILFKQYANNLNDHFSGSRILGSANSYVDVSKNAVESYLCTDGRPIGSSSVYAGDNTMYNAFRNRDRRLYYTVVPPYQVVVGKPNYTWSKTTNPTDAEYIDLLASYISANPIKKSLPMAQWSQTMQTGTTISMSPHFRNFNAGQPQSVGELGYYYWKIYNRSPLSTKNSYATTDCPLLRIEEVWLNYAEAMFELGMFNQSVADQTIRNLRQRANVANMVVADINTSFDPARDPDVDPVLWEIRRERRVELLGDGFRFNDLKRWKKGIYLNKQQLGVKVNNADFGNKLNISGGGTSGYVQFFGVPPGWLDKYYFEPIPSQEIVLNPALKQSAGW